MSVAGAGTAFRRMLPAAIALALLLSACQAGIATTIAKDGSADIDIKATMPKALAAKLRAIGKLTPGSPVFDLHSIRKSLAARVGLSVDALANPDVDSLTATLSTTDFSALLAGIGEQGKGPARLTRNGDAAELSIRLDRKGAAALAALVPGIAADVIEALAPPAIEGGDWSRDEYHEALTGVLGKTAMPAIDAGHLDISVTVPGPIQSQSGGIVIGAAWKLTIPIIDLLVLDKPMEFRLVWKR
ncbi:MAG: hypothetical protein WCQ50_00135 [Spirochaetota bacterium]